VFDEAFQEELASLYRPAERGQPPVAPAMLALALILEAYTGVSDDEVIEATVMDRRWQLVLDCVDTEEPPWSLGTLVAFRRRLIAGQMDRRLIERTIEIASQSQVFGPRALRAALDSSPLWGASRVEDTYNLVGHALKKVMRVVADRCLGYFVYLFQNQELNDHAGNLITICLMHEWRRKGADSVIRGALFGTDVSSSRYKGKGI
jgi:Transposase domain (DUF772)